MDIQIRNKKGSCKYFGLYQRYFVPGRKRRETVLPGTEKFKFQIRKIGVNINQVAAKINSGYKKYDSVFYLQKSLSQVEEEVKKLIEKLEEDSGNHKIDEYQAGEDGRGQTLK